MKTHELDWLVEFYQNESIPYAYFKDKYALDLIQQQVNNYPTIKQLKKSAFGNLTQKELVKKVLAGFGDGKINSETVGAVWTEDVHYFTLSFTSWGQEEKWRKSGYYQVSRPEPNLVLQLNFGNEHDTVFYNTIGKAHRNRFRHLCHPINKQKNTLGWVRMDIDFETNEVLIEEIQNDWIRELIRFKNDAQLIENGAFTERWTLAKDTSVEKVYDYYRYLFDIIKIWEEALLNAALDFIHKELKINTIWYHTFETGNRFKELRYIYSQPPKSIYSQLPKKFCFTETNEVPQLVKNCKYLKKYLKKTSSWNKLII